MDDYLVRVMSKEAGVRGFACLTTKLVAEAARRHTTPPAATIALGEGLTGAVLLGTLLKVGQRVAIKFAGNESGRKILVEANNNGKIRGYVSLPDDDPLLNGAEEFEGPFIEQDGQMSVVKDLRLKNLYESTVSLTGDGIVADLDNYLNRSEQLPSVVAAGITLSETESGVGKVVVAGGLLLQALPPYELDTINQLANRVQELPPIETMLNSGQTPENILALVFGEMAYEILEKIPLTFSCSCSWERSRQALISFGREELVHMLETEGQAVVDCHFCYEQYLFDAEDLTSLIDSFDEVAE